MVLESKEKELFHHTNAQTIMIALKGKNCSITSILEPSRLHYIDAGFSAEFPL